jgi:CheY-like chemotaxis protein
MSNAEKRSVLLVDDNEATRTLITAILQRDFHVETAMDGMDAVEKLKTNQYATILLDLRMPQYDGFSVLDFLKANNPEALRNVVVVTAVLSPKETDRAKAYGICDIIYKPFDVDTFLEKVKKCAGELDSGARGHTVFCSSTPMILLIADLLRQKMSF